MTSAESAPPPLLDRRARLLLPLLFVALLAATVYHYSRAPERQTYVMRGAAMGTTWSLKIAGDTPTPEQEKALANFVGTNLDRLERMLSTWMTSSAISRFNADTSGKRMPLPADARRVLAISREVSRLSGGAFDVTVDPLVRLWGFGPGRPEGPPRVPAEEQLAAARKLVGWELVDEDHLGRPRKRVPEVRVDLSAVAKGYAVDVVARGLPKLGHESFLFELGGELRAGGLHVDGTPWRVAIEAPRSEGREIHRIVLLTDVAMATSGDYRNFYEIDGRRFSHTIDPRTGRPVAHALASVTVIHPEAAWADAFATALNVLGPEAGLALAREQDLAAYFITRAGRDFEISMTERFRGFLAEPAETKP